MKINECYHHSFVILRPIYIEKKVPFHCVSESMGDGLSLTDRRMEGEADGVLLEKQSCILYLDKFGQQTILYSYLWSGLP